jgi:uncharacterized protein YdeI (YjbR/CyaY-like superfamily)
MHDKMENQMMFSSRAEFRAWLVENHAVNGGIWMVFGKAGKLKTVRPGEALEEALCFGWIDGQIKSIDESQYMKRFTPRRKGSKWSEKNRGLTAKLIDQGKMTEHGLAAIAQAKKIGTWDTPKDDPKTEDHEVGFVQAVAGFEPAFSNLQKMSLSVRRTYTAHYLSAKGEDTRRRRLEQIVARLNENKKSM